MTSTIRDHVYDARVVLIVSVCFERIGKKTKESNAGHADANVRESVLGKLVGKRRVDLIAEQVVRVAEGDYGHRRNSGLLHPSHIQKVPEPSTLSAFLVSATHDV